MPSLIRKESAFPASRSGRIVFGDFALDTRSGELRKHGSRIRLQAQPFQLLTLLLRNAGEVVTRDEICRELWPSNTFVDFEHSLAAAVNKIREALGDSADDPKYIETLPKRGYRFIGKLKPEPPAVLPVPENKDGADLVDVPKAATTRWGWRAAVIALAVMLLTAVILIRLRSDGESPTAMTAVPFTSYPGRETAPSVSPDGSRIAFSWDQATTGSGTAYDLYVKSIGSETLLRLTNHPASWISSAWSPDGTQIAFMRIDGADTGIYLVPALGGPERKLLATHTPYDLAAPLSWSPDSKWIAYSDKTGELEGNRIYLLNTETLQAHQFPHDPSCVHEGEPQFSHGGQQLAILCVHSPASMEYFVADLDGKSRRSLVTLHEAVTDTIWAGDDKNLIVSQFPPSGPRLSEIRVSDGKMRELPISTGGYWPALSQDGRKLAFVNLEYRKNIWRRDLLDPNASPVQMYESTLQQDEARYSPDGRKVAFDSARSGIWSVWVANVDGSSLVQISHGLPAGFPRWSPDSKKIAYQVSDQTGSSIYVADISGGVPRKLATNISWASAPEWSPDGKSIYFHVFKSVGHQIYRCSSDGGAATPIEGTEHLDEPTLSVDGKTLYARPHTELGDYIMMISLEHPGGTARPVPGMPAFFSGNQWTVTPKGIYFSLLSSPRTVSFYDFATQKTSQVFKVDHQLSDGMSVSPDGRYLLYAQLDQNQAKIMLVNDFR